MLESLSIRAFRLIPELDLEVGPGLTILSGETGAGKSIILEALGLALGDRADTAMIAPGESQASVVAIFTPPKHHPLWTFLKDEGMDNPEDTLILKRVLKRDGGSRAFFQDQPITLQRLRQLGGYLVDIHGQFDRLLFPADQVHFLDRFGGCQDLQRETADAFQDLRQKQDAYLRWQQDQAQTQQQRGFWSHCVEELRQMGPFPEGEMETLLQQRQVLQQGEKLTQTLQEAMETLEGGQGLREKLIQLQRAATRLSQLFPQQGEALEGAIGRLFAELDETESALQTFEKHLEVSSEMSLEGVDDRLDVLRHLSKKHQVDPENLQAFQLDLEQKLQALEDSDAQACNLLQAIETAKSSYEKAAVALYQKRCTASRTLEAQVRQYLPDLKLSQATFLVQADDLPWEQAGPQGMHRFTFWVATNPGMPAGPLHEAASGGELSRFLLILKRILATCLETGTLIFDEIESGTGGAVAQAIGATLKSLVQDQTQVLAITHAPQLAVYADHHWRIHKHTVDGKVITQVTLLSKEGHLEEVSRMLSGESITDAARNAALNLKQTALESKAC